MKKTIGRVVGPLGVLFVLFALFTRVAITGEFSAIVWGQLLLGLAGIGVFAATAFDDMRNIATGRGSVFVVTSSVATVALLAVLVGVNYWAHKQRVEWDMTEGGIHTLSEQTQSLLKALTPETKVTVNAFYRPADPEYGPLEELLRRYRNVAGDNLEVEYIDAIKNPKRAKDFGVTAQSPRLILTNAAGKEARAKDVSEEALTNALAELSRGAEKKLYFLTGHGERPIGSGAETGQGLKLWVDGLKNEGYASEELNLMARKDVPDDALALVIAGPTAPLLDGEVDAIRRFADGGGRLIVMLDPATESGLEPLLSSWGVDLLPGVIIDPESQEPLWAFTQEFSQHPIATPRMSLFGALAFVFPDARGVKQGSADGAEVTELFRTGAAAWGENDPIDRTGSTAVERGPNDDLGPIALGAAVVRKLDGGKEMRAVVFGDSDFATNQFVRQGGNRDLALNSVQWMGGQEERITIRPKLREKSSLTFLTSNQKLLLSFGSLNALPLLLIAFGLTVWSLRKAK